MTLSKLAVLLAAVALAATGQLVLKHGMVQAKSTSGQSGRSLLLVAALSPWIIGGLLIFAASAVLWLLTLAYVPLNVAYPFNALSYIAILTASTLLLHERTNAWMWLGTVLVGAGLVVVVTMAPAGPASPVTQGPAHPQAAGGTAATDSVPEPGSTPPGPHGAK